MPPEDIQFDRNEQEKFELVDYLPQMDTVFTPQWRFIEAKKSLDQRVPIRDSKLSKFIKFLKEWNAAGNCKTKLHKISKKFPTELAAYKMYGMITSLSKWYAEALIISSEKIENISHFLYTNNAVIDLYEHMFFDLRDKLSATGFVLSNVLTISQTAVEAQTRDYVWKSMGFFGGSDVLYSYWSMHPEGGDATDQYLMNIINQKIKHVALERSMTYSHDNSNEIAELPISRYIRLFEAMVKEKEVDASVETGGTISEGIESIAKSIETKLVRRSDVAEGEIKEVGARELRSDELIQIATNKDASGILNQEGTNNNG